jgi:hypothetical protein
MAKPPSKRAAAKPKPTAIGFAAPGTRYQAVITRDERTGRHRATIAGGEDHAIPALQDLSSAEMVEIMAALRAVEREVWLLDTRAAAETARG